MAETRRYRLGELVLESAMLFPELVKAADSPRPVDRRLLPGASAEVDLVVAHRRMPFQERPKRWSHHWTLPNGGLWMSLGNSAGSYFFHFPELADFTLSPDGGHVEGYRQRGVPMRTFRHLFLDQVFPVVLSRRGQTVLHGSAVATPHGAVAFVGESGRGKSTLAAALARMGHPFLTDDCLVLRSKDGRVEAVPSYAGLRVWPDVAEALARIPSRLSKVAHYSDKRRIRPGDFASDHCSEPVALRRIFFLADPTKDVKIDAPPAQAVMIELVQVNYLHDPHDQRALEWQFRSLADLARLPLFYRLSYPRDLDQLPRVCTAILDHAALP